MTKYKLIRYDDEYLVDVEYNGEINLNIEEEVELTKEELLQLAIYSQIGLTKNNAYIRSRVVKTAIKN